MHEQRQNTTAGPVRSAWRAAGAVALVLLAVAAACGEPSAGTVDVGLGELTIRAELARTAEERAQGLSGRDSLPEDAGMLFVRPTEAQPAFSMRGMRFPLDFVWIARDGRIVDLTEDVPPPQPGVADAQLPSYRPSGPVLYVLEVNAGVVRTSGVRVGDIVTFQPDVPPALP